jgi:hypothetical protein
VDGWYLGVYNEIIFLNAKYCPVSVIKKVVHFWAKVNLDCPENVNKKPKMLFVRLHRRKKYRIIIFF